MIMIRFITCNLSRIVSLIFSTQNNQSDKLKFIIFAVNTVLVENFFVIAPVVAAALIMLDYSSLEL